MTLNCLTKEFHGLKSVIKKNFADLFIGRGPNPTKKTLFSKNIVFYPPKITQQRLIIIKEAAIVYIDFMDR